MSHPEHLTLILPAKQRKIESLESDELCRDFLQQLKQLDCIETFCLSGNSYSDTFFAELAPYLSKMSHIRRVVLSDIFTTRKNEILPALRHLNLALQNKKIHLLDFSSNALCPDGCAEIVDILKTNPEIKYLYLNHVALSEAGAITIARAMQEGKLALKSLQVIKNRMENGALRMAEAIEGMSASLEELIIYQNNIKGEAMAKLLQALAQCKGVKSLDISDNLIGNEHIELLADVLNSSKGLRLLKLDDCNISAKATSRLAGILRGMPSKDLEKFTYNYNDVADMKELVDALMTHKGIRAIECKGNDVDDLDAEQFEGVDLLLESFEEGSQCEEEAVDEEKKIAELIKEINSLAIN